MQPEELPKEPAAIAYNFTKQIPATKKYSHITTSHLSNEEISSIHDPAPIRTDYEFSNFAAITATKSIVKLAGAFGFFELAQNILPPDISVGIFLSYTFGAALGVSSLYDVYCAVSNN
jgi:hypothetical protein